MSKVEALMQYLNQSARDRMEYMGQKVFSLPSQKSVDEKDDLVKAFITAEYHLTNRSPETGIALHNYFSLADKSADHALVFSHLTQIAVQHGQYLPSATEEASVMERLNATSQKLLVGASNETIALLNDGARRLSAAHTQAFNGVGQDLHERINGPKISEQRSRPSASTSQARL